MKAIIGVINDTINSNHLNKDYIAGSSFEKGQIPNLSSPVSVVALLH
jgi:hypothetical protein